MTIETWMNEELDGEGLLADGFGEALLGYVRRVGKPPMAVYDRQRCIDLLIGKGLTHEEAEEHFDFNVSGAWMGEGTPGFLVTPPSE
jgi:hypothetical protein